MNYAGPKPEEVTSVTRVDLIRFFIDFMQNNQVGVIANAHKVHADLSAEGVRDENCIRLAQIHSMAVDFNKTGIPAEMPRELTVRSFPDFMDMSWGSYPSKKILGQLYRKICVDAILVEAEHRVKIDTTLLVHGYEAFVEQAVSLKRQYDMELIHIMTQHGGQTEVEILAGQVVHQGKKCFNSLKWKIMPLTEHLHQKYRAKFEEVNGEHTADLEDWRKQKASAWYYVTYSQAEKARGKKEVLLLSFAWVMHDVMCLIKSQAPASRP